MGPFNGSRELPTLSCKNSSALQAVVQAELRVIFSGAGGEKGPMCGGSRLKSLPFSHFSALSVLRLDENNW
jgi:hypothetical protein